MNSKKRLYFLMGRTSNSISTHRQSFYTCAASPAELKKKDSSKKTATRRRRDQFLWVNSYQRGWGVILPPDKEQFDRNQINSQVQKVLVVEEKGREAEEEEEETEDDGEEEEKSLSRRQMTTRWQLTT